MNYSDKLDKIEQDKQMAIRYNIMDELIEHLDGVVRHLLHYSKKNNIQLPNLQKIYDSIERSQEFVRKGNLDQPTGNTDNNYRGGNSTTKRVLWCLR